MIGNGHDFDCGRQFAAWLGLAPGQYSSGGKARLGRITKAGDAYLRTLFILGAGRAGSRAQEERPDQPLVGGHGDQKRRILWLVLTRGLASTSTTFPSHPRRAAVFNTGTRLEPGVRPPIPQPDMRPKMPTTGQTGGR